MGVTELKHPDWAAQPGPGLAASSNYRSQLGEWPEMVPYKVTAIPKAGTLIQGVT